jgi:hypothetical protein
MASAAQNKSNSGNEGNKVFLEVGIFASLVIIYLK